MDIGASVTAGNAGLPRPLLLVGGVLKEESECRGRGDKAQEKALLKQHPTAQLHYYSLSCACTLLFFFASLYSSFCAMLLAIRAVKVCRLLRRRGMQGLTASGGPFAAILYVLLKQGSSPSGCPQSGRPPAHTFPAGSRSDRLRTCPPRSTLVTTFSAA